jgi:hypothetical protein
MGNPPAIVTSNADFTIIHCDLSQTITLPTGGKIELSIFGIQRPNIAQTYTLTFNPISGSAGTNTNTPFQGTTNITTIS